MHWMTELPYRLAFDCTLKRQVEQLPGKLRQEVRQRIADLAWQPRPSDARELRGYPGVYRCWLSDARYRLIWEVDDTVRRVEIYYVGRKPDYDDLLGEAEPGG
jgi:mRNA-degrading endonuclease RelE of RelBE toxin-antitoxin system